MRRPLITAAAVAALSVSLIGCSNKAITPSDEGADGSSSAAAGTTITYSLWDANQQPSYQKCADDFAKKSGVTVKIQQSGWDDYWNTLTTDLVAGRGPDVITNHVAYYPELATSQQLVDLQPYVDKDKVDVDQYTGDLAGLWVKDGKRYGIPQDWDTIAMVYNTADMKKGGYDAAKLADLTWNPKDGGTFGKMIAHMTVDANGVRGDEKGFDKSKVKTYGWGMEKGGGVVGQGQWSWLALSNGFTYLDKNPFGTKYQLDDPKLVETWTWLQKQFEAGYILPIEEAGSLGLEPILEQNKAAFITDGSWRINTWANSKAQDLAFAPLPKGPEGRRTIINGLAPSITTSSKHKQEAWEWVKYMTSDSCQKVVAADAIVFPSIKGMAEKVVATDEGKGIDVAPFVDITKDPANLAYYPITDKAGEINSEAQQVVDKMEMGNANPATALPELNAKINKLLS